MNGKNQAHDKQIASIERFFLHLLHPNVSIDYNQVKDKTAIDSLKLYALKYQLLPLVYTQLKKNQKAFSSHIPLMHFMEEARPPYLNNAAISMQHESIGNEILSLFHYF